MKRDEIMFMAMKSGCSKENALANIDILEAFAKLIATYVSRELAKECAGTGEWSAVHIIEGVRW